MANSLLIVTTPLYMEDHTTYPAGGGKCHEPAFFRPRGNLTWRLDPGKSTPIMQLHSTTGKEGYHCPVLFRPGVGVGDNFTCRQSSEKPIHTTQLPSLILPPPSPLYILPTPQSHCAETPKPAMVTPRAWFSYQQQPHSVCTQHDGCSVLAGCREKQEDWYNGKWWHLKLPCINGLPTE